MKKILPVALIALASATTLAVTIDSSQSNIVGYSSNEIRKGHNEISVLFGSIGDSKAVVGDLLDGACEGDVLSFGDFKATAAYTNGSLHWIADGKIVDDAKLPEKGSMIAIDRIADKSTSMTFSGEAEFPKAVSPQNSPPQRPVSNTIKPVEKPELYIADYLSYSTIRIASKTTTRGSTGTGFFFICRVKDKPGFTIPVIMTNWHVVSNAVETILMFTCMENNRPTDKSVGYVTFYPPWEKWIRHPSNNVDLAALPILPAMNAVKAQTGKDVFHMSFDASMIPDDNKFRSITQLDEVAMIGYPNGLWDDANNQPIFRKGAVATRPSLNYKGNREYLVDMSVFPGSSGSPILLVSEGMFFDRHHHSTAFGNKLMLLGVNRAVHVNKVFHEDEVRSTNAGDPNYYQPNNLGIIIHPSRLIEMENFISEILNRK